MTTPRPGQRIRGRWVLLGVILWLILASSITLEQEQETAAKWGSAAALIVIGLVALLANRPRRVDPAASHRPPRTSPGR